ncbi:MAG: isoprenylcysteine carboxylmethyltransferase family protein [Proteobacteria bacterium]|nr:isoprenylcysteine carboxylmethyltransferase family protein [Pseudomonadota bacterium]
MLARMLVRTGLWSGFMAALLCLAAGRLGWLAAWVFVIGSGGVAVAMGIALARRDPALLAERLAPPFQRDQAGWDRAVIAGAMVAWLAWIVLMALDAARYRWSTMAPALQIAGGIALLLGFLLVYRTFRANSFSAPVVKIQAARGHTVATSGPYRWVRHPMYAGALIYFLATPLLLGSWWGLACAPVLVAGLALRAVLEERWLAARLDGYADYAARVRYRLVPGVW